MLNSKIENLIVMAGFHGHVLFVPAVAMGTITFLRAHIKIPTQVGWPNQWLLRPRSTWIFQWKMFLKWVILLLRCDKLFSIHLLSLVWSLPSHSGFLDLQKNPRLALRFLTFRIIRFFLLWAVSLRLLAGCLTVCLSS